MARGWESKSIEAQIDAAEAPSSSAASPALSQETLTLIRKKESILLSRTRVTRDLKNAQNPRYRALLEKSLKELDAQLATFATP